LEWTRTVPASPLSLIALACAAGSATILIVYLVRRPILGRVTKVWLAFGLGILPLGVAGAGNVQGFEATKKREFCGSCHVMTPHVEDSNDKTSGSLASRHARNKLFGEENCYACHADYGMYGTVLTKLGGMRHVWLYYSQFHDTPIPEAKSEIHLIKPYPNVNCMQCHSTEDALWLSVSDHKASLADVRSGSLSCASAGCHGYAHPNFRPPGEPPPKVIAKTNAEGTP
jgi:nitrate/TMAO reductase-like tetraheme cytochrome c subunit